ncbi:hypothetical protein EMIHUDRAFT_446231 [Emiliania huxleyi CCMP1516]|uniref:Mitochondrial carrier protein n=2 Tax=Emiliania huxleyi TaxID=2903 RepID=A0A0D3IFS2_EMIH1|nr:hypothetical protein EMIHUDRAFT_446231 [Emiliania huxleyi CCMP1516]EOD10107.1 hypothetical protein EMIHUDRAFT_446231 [Emiliania huxleyi CCMP1516]|eukprot:XP_005762536.1 hypothetical protein EMIHUDRAFT_446231 [Emiliania huxleyi CCMP1516]
MWLRTTMNYQYRHGSSTCAAMRTLYAHGGVSRFYQGLPYALLQTPLSRFGDTAANTGVLALLSSTAAGGALPVALRTALASAAAALWRVAITPLDTLKTALQVEGRGAYELLLRRAKQNGACELWAGALASAAANFVPRVVRRFWSPPGDCLVSPVRLWTGGRLPVVPHLQRARRAAAEGGAGRAAAAVALSNTRRLRRRSLGLPLQLHPRGQDDPTDCGGASLVRRGRGVGAAAGRAAGAPLPRARHAPAGEHRAGRPLHGDMEAA